MEEIKEEFVKIVVYLPNADNGVGGEGLWSVKVGHDLYEVRNSPWHARNINWGDVVQAIPPDDRSKPVFVSVIKRSGHRTIHIFLTEGGEGRREEVLTEVKRLGASYENCDDTAYALDFEPQVDAASAIRYLEDLASDGLLNYRINEFQ